MPTLVLPPRLNDDCRAVRDAAATEGWQVFEASSWRLPTQMSLDEPVIYSESLFADVAAATLDVFLLDPPEDWLTSVPEEYVRRLLRFGSLREVRASPGGPWFLKPAADKPFKARVYASASELPNNDELPGTTSVLLSEPVRWLLEVRCFVLDRQIIALSPYFREGRLTVTDAGQWPFAGDEENQAREFADCVLSDPRVLLPASVVLDVGIIDGRGWSVVEVNPAWGAGLYGCAPKLALPALRRATIAAD